MENRLLRNEHDKVIAGVSSGLAAYMQVDVTIIRLLFVLSSIFLAGTGIFVYLVMWIVVPVNNDPRARFTKFDDFFKKQQNPFGNPTDFFGGYSSPAGFNTPPPAAGSTEPFTATEKPGTTTDWQNPGDYKAIPKQNGTGRTVGGLFLLVIGCYFLLNEFDILPYWFQLRKLWPLVFVAIGLSFILKGKRKNSWEEWKAQQDEALKAKEQEEAATPVPPVPTDQHPDQPKDVL